MKLNDTVLKIHIISNIILFFRNMNKQV